MIIKINALDTLFFKDGKPFSMGEETWADGIFPPPPSVIYGALRSAYFGNNPIEIVNAGASNDPTNGLSITKISYRVRGNEFLPLPLDFIKEKPISFKEMNKEEREKKYRVILISSQNSERIDSKSYVNTLNSNPNSYFITGNSEFEYYRTNKEVENVDNGLINKQDFSNYLNGYLSDCECLKISDYMLQEPKVGICRGNATRTTLEGKLYRVGMLRSDNFQISVKITNNDKLDFSKFTKLGAEGKIVSLEIKPSEADNKYLKIGNIDGLTKFKLYLSTPAIFENNWLPNWINKDTYEGEYKGMKLKLKSAFIGKPLLVGGFNMKKKCPKPLRKAVPAGSVYYFEITGGNTDWIKESFGKCFSISDYNLEKEGFGIAYIGRIL